jgi:hypothetical protein
MEVPGGGTFEIVVELLVVLLPPVKTFPLSVAMTVPFTVKMPPTGALGGIVLPEALAAKAMKASRVLPDVGLHESAIVIIYKTKKAYALILPTIPA